MGEFLWVVKFILGMGRNEGWFRVEDTHELHSVNFDDNDLRFHVYAPLFDILRYDDGGEVYLGRAAANKRQFEICSNHPRYVH